MKNQTTLVSGDKPDTCATAAYLLGLKALKGSLSQMRLSFTTRTPCPDSKTAIYPIPTSFVLLCFVLKESVAHFQPCVTFTPLQVSLVCGE